LLATIGNAFVHSETGRPSCQGLRQLTSTDNDSVYIACGCGERLAFRSKDDAQFAFRHLNRLYPDCRRELLQSEPSPDGRRPRNSKLDLQSVESVLRAREARWAE